MMDSPFNLIFPSVGMLDEVKVEAADPLVEDKVVDEETGEGRAGGMRNSLVV